VRIQELIQGVVKVATAHAPPQSRVYTYYAGYMIVVL